MCGHLLTQEQMDESGINGWKGKLPWAKDADGVKEMKLLVSLFEALTDQERKELVPISR